MPWACVYGSGDCAPFFRQVAENPCWDWYTEQIKEIKTPNDAFNYIVSLANGGWQFQDHVWNTVQATLHTSGNLSFMDIHPGESDEATKALSLTLHIALNRMWTMSKHSLPPDCYATVTSASADIADHACATMKTHYQNLVVLEDARHTNAAAQALWADLALVARSKPIRALFEFFCRDMYDRKSFAGLHLLKGMLWTMADNKSCEDTHGTLRLDARANSNQKIQRNRLQLLINTSGVFEARGVPHRSGVTKRDFISKFKTLKTKAMASKYRSCRHKLPKSWSKILGKKKWPTLNEESTNRTAAAWAWLHEYLARRRTGNHVSLSAARFTRLVPALQVVQCGDRFWLSLGHNTWAFLGWHLRRGVAGDTTYFTLAKDQGSANMLRDRSAAVFSGFSVLDLRV